MPPSSPVHLWGHLAAKAARLELAVGLLSLTVLLLGGTLTWYAWHGLPVHYVPPGGPGLSQPGVIPDTVATDYASRWLTARYTFTPATVKVAHAQIRTALHPILTVAFTAQAEREATLVKDVQLSTQMAILTATVIHRRPQEVTVRLEAQRTIWIGGQQVRDEEAEPRQECMDQSAEVPDRVRELRVQQLV